MEGTVTYVGDGAYHVDYTPTTYGLHTVAVMKAEDLEIQVLNLTYPSSPTAAGTFTLSLGGVESAPLAWDVDAPVVQAALEAMASIETVEVSRFGMSSSSVTSDPIRPSSVYAKSYIYSVTFTSHVGDVDPMTVNTTLLGSGNYGAVETVQEGTMAHIKATTANETAGPWVNTQLVNEVQVIVLSKGTKLTAADTFRLSFNGHYTQAIAASASAAEVRTRLEELAGIGSVAVRRNDTNSSNFGFEWQVEFTPAAGSTSAHLTNYGDLPGLVPHVTNMTASDPLEIKVLNSAGGMSATGFEVHNGVSPFVADIIYAPLSPAHSTAIDQTGVAGSDGLSTGIYQHQTSFKIEGRDEFSNRVMETPLKEVQVIETFFNSTVDTKYFSVSFLGTSAEFPEEAGIADMETLLEGLPYVGAVTVHTESTKEEVASTRLQVAYGSPEVTPTVPSSLSDVFAVGDWIRIGQANTSKASQVFTVLEVSEASPYTLTLNKPYLLASSPDAACYKATPGSHQYVVTFDSYLGDVPALAVAGTKHGNETSAAVTACAWYGTQIMKTSALTQIGGTFYLQFKGDRTADLPWDISRMELKDALEGLEAIYTAEVSERRGPFSSGSFHWVFRLVAIDGDLEPLYAEGHLLSGKVARIAIDNACPYTDTEAGSKVYSVAGRLGQRFIARLGGAEDVKANVTHLNSGIYNVTYEAPRVGTYSLAISGAQAGGLAAEYFNNRWLFGEPDVTRIDRVVDFSWAADDAITPTGKDYVSARWTGYVQPAFKEVYTFHVTANDGARLFVDGVLLLDAFDNEMSDADEAAGTAVTYDAVTPTVLEANQLVDIKLEWRENSGAAAIQLAWSSPSQLNRVVPSNRLFYDDVPIVASPYTVNPTGIKATPPHESAAAIEDWDKILVSWYAPQNYGGELTTGYRVEWWSHVPGYYGVNEVQTLRFVNVGGGTFRITSPQGHLYPFALDWDVEPETLEAALESLYDVGDVSVSTHAVSNVTRDYVVTFLSNLGDVKTLTLDPAGLEQTEGEGKRRVAVCADNKETYYFAPLVSVDAECDANNSVTGNGTLATGGSSTEITLDVAQGAPFTYVIEGVEQTSALSTDVGFGLRVSALNTLGYSVPSASLYLKPFWYPDPPTLVEIVNVATRSTRFSVYWTATTYPRDRASIVTSYAVEWNTEADFTGSEGGYYENLHEMFPCDRRDHPVHGEWLNYTIDDLTPGLPYYVRVYALNAKGRGAPQTSEPTWLTAGKTPDQLAYGVGVELSTIPPRGGTSVGESSTSLLLAWQPPAFDHGVAVSQYLIEYWRETGRDEVQVLKSTCTANMTGYQSGTFTVEYDGATTDTLPFDVAEVDLEAALEGLPTLRDVHVLRSANPAVGYEWTVTFLSEVPFWDSKTLVLDGTGLDCVGNGSVSTSVGFDLQPKLPGWKLTTSVVTAGGSDTITADEITGVDVGDFVRLEASIHQVVAVAPGTKTITLDAPYYGTVDGAMEAYFGETVPGTRAYGMNEVVVPVTEESADAYSHVLTDLIPGQSYYARVSALNDFGYSQPRASLPVSVKALKQKPDIPTNVQLVVNSGTSLKLIWNHPESDGGETITKYRVEWDVLPTFDTSLGSPLGSQHRVLTSPATDCKTVPCHLQVSSLTKGTPYYVRVYAYNAFGYSVLPGVPATLWESPKHHPVPPAYVAVTPKSDTSMLVRFPASADDGGGEITKYRVEWDTVGVEGAEAGVASYGASLLYAPHSVQTIETAADTFSLYGSFRVAFNGYASDPVAYDVAADDLRQVLEGLPSVGASSVSRYEKNFNVDGSYGIVWTVSFLTAGGEHEYFGDAATLGVSVDAQATAEEFFSGPRGVLNQTLTMSNTTTLLCGTCEAATLHAEKVTQRMLGYAEQVLTISSPGSNVTLGGTFTLRRDTFSTDGLPADASPRVVEMALEALGNVGDVTVARKANTANGYSWIVVFVEELGYQPALVLDGSGLTCSDPTKSPAWQVDATYVPGALPLMDSANKRSVELSGEAIADQEMISYEIQIGRAHV